MDIENILEVSIRDKNEDEHIYWVEMCEEDDMDEDIAIERAVAYHGLIGGVKPLRNPEEDNDDDPAIVAYEPFDREEGEYTLVSL